MEKTLPTLAALAGAFVLQVGLAPHLTIGGVQPDFLLIVVVTLALSEGPVAASVAGFGAGLLLDLLGAGPVGPGALVFAGVGYMAGLLGANMFAEGVLVPVTVVFVATLIAGSALALSWTFLGVPTPFWQVVGTLILPQAVYNTGLALLVFPLLARFLRRERQVTSLGRIG